MDKIKLLNSIYVYETNAFLSPSDIVLNCFDEFMIMTSFITTNVEKIYVSISNGIINFIIPDVISNMDPNSIHLDRVMTYTYAGRLYNVLPSINSQGCLNLSIMKA